MERSEISGKLGKATAIATATRIRIEDTPAAVAAMVHSNSFNHHGRRSASEVLSFEPVSERLLFFDGIRKR